MTKGVCVQKSPYAMELEAGDYYWCACGLSKKQPFWTARTRALNSYR